MCGSRHVSVTEFTGRGAASAFPQVTGPRTAVSDTPDRPIRALWHSSRKRDTSRPGADRYASSVPADDLSTTPAPRGLDDLYDISRLAARLGVEHSTIRVWLSRKVPWLPAPDGRLNGGAVWRATTLEGIEQRRTPGRPGRKPGFVPSRAAADVARTSPSVPTTTGALPVVTSTAELPVVATTTGALPLVATGATAVVATTTGPLPVVATTTGALPLVVTGALPVVAPAADALAAADVAAGLPAAAPAVPVSAG